MFHHSSHHSKNTSYSHQKSNSRVRAIHNVAKGPNVNIVIDGKIALGDVSYKAISDYLRVPSGKHSISINDKNNVLASVELNLVSGKDYTIIAHGDVNNLSSIALLPLEDNNSCPAKGKSHVRFIHAAATVPNVDIWANMQDKIFSNVSYGSLGNPSYLPVHSGDITLAVTPANKTDVVLGPLPLRLDTGKTYSIIASGKLDDDETPITALVTQDNSCSTVHLHWF